MYEYYRRLNRSINDCYKCISCGSQTGSPSSSDLRTSALLTTKMTLFQSQTGSPSSSDSAGHAPRRGLQLRVSIPNGKPILFRPISFCDVFHVFTFQSQTGSPSSSDHVWHWLYRRGRLVSIPNGKPILFRPSTCHFAWRLPCKFQSQTGSPSSSDARSICARFASSMRFNPKREAHPLQTNAWAAAAASFRSFQSQTGSPSSSDLEKPLPFRDGELCFNPKREAHPLQTRNIASVCERHEPSFNPKREAHPLQTGMG